MNSLGRGPETVCSYGEGSCTRAFAVREERSGWSKREQRERPDLQAGPAQERYQTTPRPGQTGLGGCGYASRARRPPAKSRAPSRAWRRGKYSDEVSMLQTTVRDLCINKVREEIRGVFQTESFWMQ